ncbi:MAG: hypothetical protein IAB93_03535 [Bacteroidetes bacterium]|uniref:BACON domain-containing protein n=1 Tax=Candidatus Merdivivens pullistercoris TaxID=2840873 RepID=A0A9D9I317_9BACT|nr:hypothetical protein [Candidatus Merdivivens pullistercoris]
MKRLSLFATVLSVAFTALTGCEEPEPAPVPVFGAVSSDDINAPAEGGTFKIAYSIENPAEDGKVSATSEQSEWITGIDCETSGEVVFEVTPNESETPREGKISVFYEYTGETQSFEINVIQEGSTTPAPAPDPVLTLTSEDEISAPAQGGQYEIKFKIDNPASDGEVSAIGDTWITPDPNIGSQSLMVTVAANDGEPREGTVTVKYSYNEGNDEQTIQVKVVQASLEDSYPDAFNISYHDVSFSMAWVESSCNYPELLWRAQIISKDEYEERIGGDMSAMRDYFIDLLYTLAVEYGYEDMEGFMGFFLLPGDKSENWQHQNLSEGTTYMTYAVAMDYSMNFITDFQFGPEFTTTEKADFSVKIEVVPDVNSAVLNFYPSDQSTYFFGSAIEKELFEDYYTDESLMEEICEEYGSDLIYSSFLGDRPNYTVKNLKAGTEYYAYAFGVDPYTQSSCSVLSKLEFRTLEGQSSSDLYASAEVTYWDIDGLNSHNPEYGNVFYGPAVAALDIVFEGSTPRAMYYQFENFFNLSDAEIVDNTEIMGTPVNAGDPAPMVNWEYDTEYTVCVLGMDENGNYGDEAYIIRITPTVDGVSTDYSLFDRLYNE